MNQFYGMAGVPDFRHNNPGGPGFLGMNSSIPGLSSSGKLDPTKNPLLGAQEANIGGFNLATMDPVTGRHQPGTQGMEFANYRAMGLNPDEGRAMGAIGQKMFGD